MGGKKKVEIVETDLTGKRVIINHGKSKRNATPINSDFKSLLCKKCRKTFLYNIYYNKHKKCGFCNFENSQH